MANIRDLKRLINNELSSVIEECYVWQLVHASKSEKAEDVIDEAIAHFDTFMVRINEDNIHNKKTHFQGIKTDLQKVTAELLKKLSEI